MASELSSLTSLWLDEIKPSTVPTTNADSSLRSLWKALPFVEPRANTFAVDLAAALPRRGRPRPPLTHGQRRLHFVNEPNREDWRARAESVLGSDASYKTKIVEMLFSEDQLIEQRACVAHERERQCVELIAYAALRWLYMPRGPIVRRYIREMRATGLSLE